MAEVSRHEFNGLGERLNQVQLEQATIKSETERNGQDIQHIFTAQEEASKSISQLALTISDANSKLGWKIAGLVSVPTLFSVIQIAMMFLKNK